MGLLVSTMQIPIDGASRYPIWGCSPIKSYGHAVIQLSSQARTEFSVWNLFYNDIFDDGASDFVWRCWSSRIYGLCATSSHAVQCSAMQCNAVQCSAMQCNAGQRNQDCVAVWHSVAQCGSVCCSCLVAKDCTEAFSVESVIARVTLSVVFAKVNFLKRAL